MQIHQAFSVVKANGINPKDFVRVEQHPKCVYDAVPSCKGDRHPTNIIGRVAHVIRGVGDSAVRMVNGVRGK